MPDTYLNPYAGETPIAKALKNLSTTIVSGPSDGKRLAEAEYALKLKQARENTAALGDVFRNYGTPQFDRGAALDNAIRAGVTGDNLGAYERYGAANTYGADAPQTTNAFVGAGGSFGSTAAGTREQQANDIRKTKMGIDEQRYQFDNKPMTIGTDKGPVIVRQNEAYGQPAVEDLGKVKGNAARIALNSPGGIASADEPTQRFIGASGKANGTPRNYVFQGKNFITDDGITDARTGHPLPAGGYLATPQGSATDVGLSSSNVTDLQKQDIANQRFRGLLGFTRNLAKASPDNFGVSGFVKGAVQDATQIAGNVSQGLGYKGITEAVNDMRSKVAANGLDPKLFSGVFDPKLPALHTAADLLVFSAADALAGQSGRSVTDRDVKMFKDIVGDPREWAGNQEKYLSKLDTVEQILNINQGVIDNRLRGVPAAQAAPGASAVPPGAASGAPQPLASQAPAAAQPSGETWDRGPDGVLRRVQ